MKLLFVDENSILLESMVNYFSTRGLICEHAKNYNQARIKINSHKYDIIVIDIILSGGNGMDLIPQIKSSHCSTGIIIVSAKNSLKDKVNGLNMGADDYLTKPFDLEELHARVNALYRRKALKGDDLVTFGGFSLRPLSKELLYKDKLINLTKKEFNLLMYFVINKNRVVGKGAIAEHIWGDNYCFADNFDAIYVHLTNLRKKIMRACGKDYITTVWGMGYKFVSS